MKANKILFVILVSGSMLFSHMVRADLVYLTQDSDFKFMYTKTQQERLLYDAEVIVEKELKFLGCKDINVTSKITEEMYDPGFFQRLLGEKSKSAKYSFGIEADCPERLKALQTYVSFAFHTSDIDTVFYYGYYDNDNGKIEVNTVVHRWGQLPQREEDFKGYAHCNGDWRYSKFNLLQEFFCD